MAKKVSRETDDEKEDDGRTVVGIVKGKLKALLARCRTRTAAMDAERAELGTMIANAVDKDHLHKGSFGWIRRLDRMEAVARNEWLYHFDLMRDHMGWEQSDLLPDRQVAEDDEKAPQRRVPRRVADFGENVSEAEVNAAAE